MFSANVCQCSKNLTTPKVRSASVCSHACHTSPFLSWEARSQVQLHFTSAICSGMFYVLSAGTSYKAQRPIRLSTANGALGLLKHLIWLKMEDDERAIKLVCADRPFCSPSSENEKKNRTEKQNASYGCEVVFPYKELNLSLYNLTKTGVLPSHMLLPRQSVCPVRLTVTDFKMFSLGNFFQIASF